MDSKQKLTSIASLSAEHLSCLVKLTETWLLRKDGLESSEKILIIMMADLQHMKALHQVVQSSVPIDSRMLFSQLLRQLAEAEECEEKKQKGGG